MVSLPAVLLVLLAIVAPAEKLTIPFDAIDMHCI